MVKHGTAKKRRRGLKVSRKPQKHRNVRVASAVPPEIKDAYDKTKSPAENLASFGLEANPNIIKKKQVIVEPGIATNKKKPAFLGFATVPESDDMQDRNPRRRKMSEFDQKYVVKCIKKHGEDYKAMERDIKLNTSQYTESRMRTMCKTYMSLDDSERLVSL
jgi:Ribosome biogenesis protein Nop16